MPNLVNKMVVRELTDAFRDASSMLVVSMSGLTMKENEELRTSLAEGGVEIRMVRNSLAQIALKECGVEIPASVFEGNIAIAAGDPEHAVHAAKVVSKHPARKDGRMQFRAGLLEGELLDGARATELADMPDRPTLQAMLLGVLSGPARSLVGLVAAPGSSLARVVQARVDAQGGGDAA